MIFLFILFGKLENLSIGVGGSDESKWSTDMFKSDVFIGSDTLRVYENSAHFERISVGWESWTELHSVPGGGQFVAHQRVDHSRKQRLIEFSVQGAEPSFTRFQALLQDLLLRARSAQHG